MSETAHFFSKNSFPDNWIVGANGIIGSFFTSDGVVYVGDVLVVLLHKELIKSGKLSMLAEGMHVTTVETIIDGNR